MKRAVIAAISILVVIVVAAAVYYLGNSRSVMGTAASDNILNSRFGVANITEHYNNATTTRSVYLALTPQQQQEGYMNVSTIGDCNNTGQCIGMLFVFQNQTNLCFWMENTAIQLRQTWLNQSGYPTYTYVGTPYSTQLTCSYGKYVIETEPNISIIGYITLNNS